MPESTESGDESEEALRDDGEFYEETDSFEDPIAILEFLPATENGGPNRSELQSLNSPFHLPDSSSQRFLSTPG